MFKINMNSDLQENILLIPLPSLDYGMIWWIFHPNALNYYNK